MANTTISFSAVSAFTMFDLPARGVYAVFAKYTYTATISASQVYLAVPIPDQAVVLDGYVFSNHNASYSFKVIAGLTDETSKFIVSTELVRNVALRFHQGIPYTVSVTDTNTVLRMKPLAVTVTVAASGTLNGAMTVMALLQR